MLEMSGSGGGFPLVISQKPEILHLQCIDVLKLTLWVWMDIVLCLTWARARSQMRLREFLRGSQNEVVVLL